MSAMLPAPYGSIGRRSSIRSMRRRPGARAGLVHLTVALNDSVEAGQVDGDDHQIFASWSRRSRPPLAGPIVRIATFPIVMPAERIIQIGVPR